MVIAALLTAEGKYADALTHIAACLRVRPGDEAAWEEHIRLRKLTRNAPTPTPVDKSNTEEGTVARTSWETPGELKAPGWTPSQEVLG